MTALSDLYRGKYDLAAKQMLAVLIGASAASQNGKNARCWTFASDELATKTGALYSTTNKAYLDVTSAATYTTGISTEPTTLGVTSLRTVVPSASISKSGSKITVTFKSIGSVGLVVSHASIVERSGSTADGAGTPIELTFSGASGFSISTNSTITSDIIDFVLDKTKSYLVIIDVTSGNPGYVYSGTTYTKSSVTSYNQQTVSGFSSSTITYGLSSIQVITVNDSVLVPSAISTASAPTRMDAFFLVQPVDTITLNADLLAYVSRDGGSNYATGTLKLVTAYDSTYNLYRATFKSATLPASGTSVLWKLASANSKQIAVRGAVMFWEL